MKDQRRSLKFSSQYRLSSREQFGRFFAPRKWVFRVGGAVIFQIPNETGHLRLGMTIKTRLRSVERSYLKRVIREFFRTHQGLLKGYDYNVVIPSHLGKLSREQIDRIRKELEENFLDEWIRKAPF